MTDTHAAPALLLERQGAIATLAFNRPAALNAVDVPMAQALLAAAQHLAADPTVRAVVLRGEGKGFMAGGDLATLAADPVQGAIDLIGPLNEAVALLHSLNAPVIAQVHGVAAGAGLSLMLQADFVMAAEGTRFNLAYINLGASCDVGASWALPRLVGLRKALEIAMLGDTLSATEALHLGLVNRVVPAPELGAAVHQLAQRLARQHGTGGGETQVHQAHQHNRNGRPIHAELHPAGDHLRQAKLGPLRRMQRHDATADQLTDEQADQRPEHITAQHHGQRPGDNRSDLQVGTHPQGELTE